MNAPAKPARGPWIVVAVLVALPLVTCGGCVGYPLLKLRWAKATVYAYCDDDVVVGAPIAGLEAKARRRGLNVFDTPPDTSVTPARPGTLSAWEGWVFARHFCLVEHDGHTVLTKRTNFLD